MSNADTRADTPSSAPVIDLDPDDVVEDGVKKPEPVSTPASAGAKGRSTAGLVALALLAGLLVGGWFYREFLASYFPSDSVAVMHERLVAIDKTNEELATRLASAERLAEQLTKDIDAIESKEATQSASLKQLVDGQLSQAEQLGKLGENQATVEAEILKLKSLPTAAVPTGSSAPLPAELYARIDALESEVAALKASKVAATASSADKQVLTQAMADLKAKVASGVAFADEQSRIAALVPTAGGLEVLARHAAEGLPSAAGLALELAALKPSLPTPDLLPQPSAEQGLWDQMLDALSDVITIRDLDAVNWQTVAEKAQAFADAGDLAQAIAVIDAVEAAKPPSLQLWRERAHMRIELESAVTAATESVARQLAAAP